MTDGGPARVHAVAHASSLPRAPMKRRNGARVKTPGFLLAGDHDVMASRKDLSKAGAMMKITAQPWHATSRLFLLISGSWDLVPACLLSAAGMCDEVLDNSSRRV